MALLISLFLGHNWPLWGLAELRPDFWNSYHPANLKGEISLNKCLNKVLKYPSEFLTLGSGSPMLLLFFKNLGCFLEMGLLFVIVGYFLFVLVKGA